LEEGERRVDRRTAEVEAFASVASHDLAQPLQVAYGYLEMLRTDYAAGLDPTAAQWLDAALVSMERMRRLVHDILAFGRSGGGEVASSEVDLERVVDAALARVAPRVDECDARVVRGDLPFVRGHEGLLTDVVTHLLDNALRFAEPGRRPTVRIGAEATSEGWVVTVADDGPGVPAALADRVFEAFERGPASSGAGAGLGLALCRKLVQRHGGRLWLERDPEPTSGATFRFSLPRRPHVSSTG
jgi:signal transduction histidine kinase